MAFAKREDTHARFVKLLRILLPGQYHLDVCLHVYGYFRGHLYELVAIPFTVSAMGGWQMIRDGSVLEHCVVAQMIRYLGALQVYSYFMAIVGYLNLLSDITERNAVAMAVLRQLHVAVLHDCAHPGPHDLKRTLGQGLEIGCLFLKQVLAAIGTSLEVTLVKLPQRLSNGSVYLLDGEEGHIPQRRKDLLVDHSHVPFNQRFVLWVAHPCRQHYGIVVMRHLHQQGINFRLIFVSLGHGALEVVRHMDLRHASIVFQCVSQTLRKALLRLARAGFDISVFFFPV